MKCRQCGKENDEGSIFCSFCGIKMESKQICGQCGRENDAEDKFCIYCGAVLETDTEAMFYNDKEQLTQNEKENFSKRIQNLIYEKKKLFIALAAVMTFVLVICIGSMIYFTGDTYQCKRDMRLAEKFYEEEKYRQALYYYEAALELDRMLIEAYLKSADIYETDGEYKKALERVKEGIAETGSERLLEKQLELYLIQADIYAKAGDEAGELEILNEAIETTGEAVFVERREMIYQRQAEALAAQEESLPEIDSDISGEEEIWRQEGELWEEIGDAYFGEGGEIPEEDVYFDEDYEWEDFELEENSDEKPRTDLGKFTDDSTSNQYSIADFYGKEIRTYTWDGVNRKVSSSVSEAVNPIGLRRDGTTRSFTEDEDKECMQLLMCVSADLAKEWGTPGTNSIVVTKCSEMNGYSLLDGKVYAVQDIWNNMTEADRVRCYIRIDNNTWAYLYPRDVTPN